MRFCIKEIVLPRVLLIAFKQPNSPWNRQETDMYPIA
jgi:hypothetical protein